MCDLEMHCRGTGACISYYHKILVLLFNRYSITCLDLVVENSMIGQTIQEVGYTFFDLHLSDLILSILVYYVQFSHFFIISL